MWSSEEVDSRDLLSNQCVKIRDPNLEQNCRGYLSRRRSELQISVHVTVKSEFCVLAKGMRGNQSVHKAYLPSRFI